MALIQVLPSNVGFLSFQGALFLAGALLIAAGIIELIRRRYLRESYAMLWLAFSAVLLVFGLVPQLLFWISELLHLYYLTTALLISFLFLVMIVLQYSIALSRRAEENRQIVQRLALLQEKIERLERAASPTPQAKAGPQEPAGGKP